MPGQGQFVIARILSGAALFAAKSKDAKQSQCQSTRDCFVAFFDFTPFRSKCSSQWR